MVPFMKENLIIILFMVKENIYEIMGNHMKVNGSKIKWKVKE